MSQLIRQIRDPLQGINRDPNRDRSLRRQFSSKNSRPRSSSSSSNVGLELIDPILRKHKVDMYICGHIHNFQHIRRPGSDIDYIVNSAGSLARKVKPTEGTVFCNPEPGFSVVSADKKELTLRMIDKKGNILHTISRKK